MIEKPKRPAKIPNQDNKQPQTINELIRRYDLDNTKIYDFLDELVEMQNLMQDNIESAVNGEIGQWTPIISTIENKEPTLKYTEQVGEYIKYGNLVWINFHIGANISALNGTYNQLAIRGLPFEDDRSIGVGYIPLTISRLSSLVENETNVSLVVENNMIKSRYNFGSAINKVKTGYVEVAASGWYKIKNS